MKAPFCLTFYVRAQIINNIMFSLMLPSIMMLRQWVDFPVSQPVHLFLESFPRVTDVNMHGYSFSNFRSMSHTAKTIELAGPPHSSEWNERELSSWLQFSVTPLSFNKTDQREKRSIHKVVKPQSPAVISFELPPLILSVAEWLKVICFGWK